MVDNFFPRFWFTRTETGWAVAGSTTNITAAVEAGMPITVTKREGERVEVKLIGRPRQDLVLPHRSVCDFVNLPPRRESWWGPDLDELT